MDIRDIPKELLDKAKEIRLEKGEVLLKEGTVPSHFYWVAEGQVEVVKKVKNGEEYCIEVLKKGDIVAGIAVIDKKKQSATVRALQGSSLLAFPLSGWSTQVETRLIPGLVREMADRIRYVNDVTVAALEKKIKEAKARDLMAFLMVSLFSIFAIYILLFDTLVESLRYSLYIFMAMMIVLGTLSFALLKRSKLPLSTFGLTLKHWQRSLSRALPGTLVLVALTIAAKWVYLKAMGIQNEPLIHPLYERTTVQEFLLFLGVYIVLAPMQELLARGILQSLFSYLLSDERKKRVWTSIFLSNLLYAVLHTYVSIGLMLCAFVPGLFWGWLYEKQRDLVGVSISHIILGVWAFAILGFTYLFV